jgi:hypothetical protein
MGLRYRAFALRSKNGGGSVHLLGFQAGCGEFGFAIALARGCVHFDNNRLSDAKQI